MSREAPKSKPYVREAEFEDCYLLAETMRDEDKEEVWHSSRLLPVQALVISFTQSSSCWTVIWDGKVTAMFGVSPKDEFVGVPWLLASEDLKRIRKSFLRESAAYVEQMFEKYELLTNFAWTKNTTHIQWLRWLGFKFLPPCPVGLDSELFYEFYKVK